MPLWIITSEFRDRSECPRVGPTLDTCLVMIASRFGPLRKIRSRYEYSLPWAIFVPFGGTVSRQFLPSCATRHSSLRCPSWFETNREVWTELMHHFSTHRTTRYDKKSWFWNLDRLLDETMALRPTRLVFAFEGPHLRSRLDRCRALQHASIQTCNNFWANSHSVEGKMKREKKRKKYKDFSRLPLSTTQEYLTTLAAIFPRSKMYLPREWRARLWPILTFDDDGGDVSCQRELSPF